MPSLRFPSLATLRAFRPTRRQLLGIGVAILVPSAWLLARGPAASDNSLVARVKRGPFAVTVNTSGELRARQFVQITAPAGAQQVGAWQMKIQSIVPEGTIVKQGDIVAELDRSTLANKLDEVRLALQKASLTSSSLFARVERSSSATMSPCFTIVPSGTMDWIFICHAPTCCAPAGAVIWTNCRARSSPEVLTVTAKGPRFTRATRELSEAAGPRARSHALGTRMATPIPSSCRRVGRNARSVASEGNRSEGMVPPGEAVG